MPPELLRPCVTSRGVTAYGRVRWQPRRARSILGTRMADTLPRSNCCSASAGVGGNFSAAARRAVRILDPHEMPVELARGWQVKGPHGVRLSMSQCHWRSSDPVDLSTRDRAASSGRQLSRAQPKRLRSSQELGEFRLPLLGEKVYRPPSFVAGEHNDADTRTSMAARNCGRGCHQDAGAARQLLFHDNSKPHRDIGNISKPIIAGSTA
jgi:hypothetical protein